LINWRTITARRQHTTDDLRKANREIYVETENELRKALFVGASKKAATSGTSTTVVSLARLSIVITRDLYISKTVNIPPIGGITIRSINGAVIVPNHSGTKKKDKFPVFRWLRAKKIDVAGISPSIGLILKDLSTVGVQGRGVPFSALLTIDEEAPDMPTGPILLNLKIEACRTGVWIPSSPSYLFDSPVPLAAPSNAPLLGQCSIVNNQGGWGIRGAFFSSSISDNVTGPLDLLSATRTAICGNVAAVYTPLSIVTVVDGGENVVTNNVNTAIPVGFINPTTIVANNVL
jgi:hypothetical protein